MPKKTRPKSQKLLRAEKWDTLKESPDYWELACELVTQGQHLREIANASGAKFSTWYSFVTNHPQILAQYQAALAARAEVARERIEALTEEILGGEIDPKSARVALEALKWRAEAGGGRHSQFRQDKGTTVQVAVSSSTNPFSTSYLEALRMHNQTGPALIDIDNRSLPNPLNNPSTIDAEYTETDINGSEVKGKGSERMGEEIGKGLGKGLKKGSGRDQGKDQGKDQLKDQGRDQEGIGQKGTKQDSAADLHAQETAAAIRGFTLSASRLPRGKLSQKA